MTEREQTIKKIIQLIIDDLEEPNKGNLTTRYALGVLQDTITCLETKALMSPAHYSLRDKS